MRAWTHWRTLLGPDEDETSILWTCASAIWFWDRGHSGDFDDMVATALREKWICPPAFYDIHDEIRAGRRPVSLKRLVKMKTDPGEMYLAVSNLFDAQVNEQGRLRNRVRRILLRPDPEPHAEQRVSEARLAAVAGSLANDLGISVAVLKRAEREFRQLILALCKK